MIDFDVSALSGGDPIAADAAPQLFRRAGAVKAKRGRVLPGIPPNAGIAAMYRKALLRLCDEMFASVRYFLTASYRANPPEMAADDLSADALAKAIAALVGRWDRNFARAAEKLAEYFATKVSDRSDAVLKRILKDGGFTIEFKMSRAQRDVFNAIVHENVSLIKSIPRQFLGEVEQMTMRSVAAGRDLKALQDDLQKRFNITRNRAILISRDQNNKATGALHRVRQLEIGGEGAEAIWVHSGNHRNARPTHLAAGNAKTRFKVKDGWFDPAVGRHIQCGELISCRCFSKLVIPGLD